MKTTSPDSQRPSDRVFRGLPCTLPEPWPHAWLVAAIAATVFLLNLGGAKLWDDDEPKNAACGYEMLERGDYVVPVFNEELREHKPVMLYWWMIASYSAFGVSEFASRLPSALACVGVVLLCYQIGRLLFDRTTGLVAALLLTSGVFFAVLARAATPDGLLMLFSTAALASFVAGARRVPGDGEQAGVLLPWVPAIGMYAAMGLGVLTKGPIGVLLPLTAIFGFVLLGLHDRHRPNETASLTLMGTARWLLSRLAPFRLLSVARGLRVASGLAIVAAIALPWYFAVSTATEGEWVRGFLGTHNVHRFLSPMEGHRGPIFYHLISVTAGMFPASCFLPVAIVGSIAAVVQRRLVSESYALLLCWAGVWIGFFSVAATKLPNYVAPSYLALALLVGAWLVAASRGAMPARSWLRVGFAAMALVGVAMIAGLGFAAPRYFGGDYSLALFGLPLLVGGAVACWLAAEEERMRTAVGTFVAASVVFTAAGMMALAPKASVYQASPRVAAAVAAIEQQRGVDRLVVASHRYTKPNLTFYLHRRVTPVDSQAALAEFLDNDNAVAITPRDVYDQVKSELPFATTVVASTPRLFKPGEEVLVVAKTTSVAAAASRLR